MRLLRSALVALALTAFASPVAADQIVLSPEVPPLDREWTLADYSQAVAAVTALSDAELPRSSTEDGARLIARLSDPAPLAFCADRERPMSERVEPCVAAGGATRALSRRYVDAARRDGALADDCMRLHRFFYSYILAINEPEGLTPAGVAQLRLGHGQVLLGGAMMIQDPMFSEQARAEFVPVYLHAYRALRTNLAPEFQTQIRDQLARAATAETNADTRVALLAVL